MTVRRSRRRLYTQQLAIVLTVRLLGTLLTEHEERKSVLIGPRVVPDRLHVFEDHSRLASVRGELPQALRAVAIELDANLAEAYTALAFATWAYDWNFDEAERLEQPGEARRRRYRTGSRPLGPAWAVSSRTIGSSSTTSWAAGAARSAQRGS